MRNFQQKYENHHRNSTSTGSSELRNEKDYVSLCNCNYITTRGGSLHVKLYIFYLIKNVTYFFLAWEVKEINIYKKSFGMNLLLWKSLFLTTFNTICKNIVAAGILQIFNFKYSIPLPSFKSTEKLPPRPFYYTLT